MHNAHKTFLHLLTAASAAHASHSTDDLAVPVRRNGLTRPAFAISSLNIGLETQNYTANVGDCGVNQEPCKDGCMPILGTCCEEGDGWCDIMAVCVSDGCCAIGDTCSDNPDGCPGDMVACGSNDDNTFCMLKDKKCCPGGTKGGGSTYCEQDEICPSGDSYGCTASGDQAISKTSATSSIAETQTESTSLVRTSSQTVAASSTIASNTDDSDDLATTGITDSASQTTEATQETNSPDAASKADGTKLLILQCSLAFVYFLLQ